MGRHLVLTVHGIGEQKPGDTVDAIVGAATTDLVVRDETPSRDTRRSIGPVDVFRDLIDLSEGEFDGTSRKARIFPVHLRRVRRARTTDSSNDAVFAEVYWADKSPAPDGFFRTAFDLLKVTLGLGYIGIDNVENTRGRATVFLFHSFIWSFYALVAPLNAILLIGAALLLLDPFVFEIGNTLPTHIILLLQGLIAGAVGLGVWRSPKPTYLIRLFAVGMFLFSGVILVIWLGFAVSVLTVIPKLVTSAHASVFDFFNLTPRPVCPDPGTVHSIDAISRRADPSGGLECFVSYTIAMLEFAWTVTITLAFVLFALEAVNSLRRVFGRWIRNSATTETDDGSTQCIYPAIAGAMLMFWMTFTTAFWMLFSQFVTRLSTPRDHNAHPRFETDHSSENIATAHAPEGFLLGIFDRQFQDAQDTLGLSIYGLVTFVLAAGFVVLLRACNRDALGPTAAPPSRFCKIVTVPFAFVIGAVQWLRHLLKCPPSYAYLTRVILNPIVRIVLNLFLLSLFLLAMSLLLQVLEAKGPVREIADRIAQIGSFNTGGVGTLTFDDILTFAALGIGLFIYNFPTVVAGGLGVVRDIVTYAIQDRNIRDWVSVTQPSYFAQRNAINQRFFNVLRYSLNAVKPSRITIISHSQGTVIATQMLQNIAVKEALSQNGNPPITLVTMGSPVTQVYRHYFPRTFQVTTKNMPSGLRWHNIYRIDDYVGTKIAEDTGVEQNLAVDAAGHVGYFTDYQVWTRMWNDVGFRMFDPQLDQSSE